VLDALGGNPLADCVLASEIPNLSILPLGDAAAHDGERVSPLAIQRLVDAARRDFDVVLIDTGPLPGGFECSGVAAVADGVILTVTRGEKRERVQECIDCLVAVGAHLAGVVLNRATAKDLGQLRLSSYNRSTQRGNNGANGTNGNGLHAPGRRAYGPFGQAMLVASTKETSNGHGKKP